jgi:hypothetical protein
MRVALAVILFWACALGQNFGNAPESGTVVTVVSTTGVPSTVPLTTTTPALTQASTTGAGTTTSVPATTGPVQTFSKAVVRQEPLVELGCPADPPLAPPSQCLTTIGFVYQDLFAGTNSQYCCPHREGLAVINGTGGVVASPFTPTQSYEYPQAVIGSATLSDSTFSIGLTLSIDPSFLLRGRVVTLTLQWSKSGVLEGSALFASGLVPLTSTPLVLSGFYPLPKWGLNSTIGYDLLFRLSDNGPVTSQLASQWTRPFTAQANPLSQYWVAFPARAAFV